MRNLLILAVAAFLAVGCAGRTEDETGAAPDQGDATVTATDTTAVQTDTTTAQTPAATDTSFVQPDTTAAADATMGTDSVGAQAEVQPTDPTATDSTAAGTYDATVDTTAKQ